MARFDVYRLRDGELAIDCQASAHRHLSTRFVIPLRDAEGYPAKKWLNPKIDLNEESYVLVTEFASTVFQNEIAETIGNVKSAADEITRAIDFLTGGF